MLNQSQRKSNWKPPNKTMLKKVNTRIKTGIKPNKWNEEAERLYRNRLQHEQGKKEWKEKIEKITKEKQENKSKFDYDFSQADEAVSNMRKLINEIVTREAKKELLTKKMRLTGDNASHEFNQVLIDYLDSLVDNSQKLEACYNGIKIFKAYIREHDLIRA